MTLAEYDAIVPGTAERFLALQAREHEARIAGERLLARAEADARAVESDARAVAADAHATLERARAAEAAAEATAVALDAERRRLRAAARAELDRARADTRRQLAAARAFEIRSAASVHVAVTGTCIGVLGAFSVVALVIGYPVAAIGGVVPAVLLAIGHALAGWGKRTR